MIKTNLRAEYNHSNHGQSYATTNLEKAMSKPRELQPIYLKFSKIKNTFQL